ncbi:hypothetical protein SCLCIDRAFT_1215948 [Scleroderma citrinum Foug A]|uniref:Uncharacterized protein n=1 Tax=Scleroderma citrinum Foug A TaxID=1036808 RepID=A0A0C3DLD1_9AGAM|nr:hypothetical protein SCLCIDRAFT_1215948 [Scleroderma citrinum Foug A]
MLYILTKYGRRTIPFNYWINDTVHEAYDWLNVPPLDLPLDPPLVGLQLLSPQTAEWHLLKAIATHFVVEAVFKYQALKREDV